MAVARTSSHPPVRAVGGVMEPRPLVPQLPHADEAILAPERCLDPHADREVREGEVVACGGNVLPGARAHTAVALIHGGARTCTLHRHPCAVHLLPPAGRLERARGTRSEGPRRVVEGRVEGVGLEVRVAQPVRPVRREARSEALAQLANAEPLHIVVLYIA